MQSIRTRLWLGTLATLLSGMLSVFAAHAATAGPGT